MTREQLLREVCRYAGHLEWCDTTERSYLECTCGWTDTYRQVEDALATERTSSAADESLPSPEAPSPSGGMRGSREHHPRRFFTGGES